MRMHLHWTSHQLTGHLAVYRVLVELVGYLQHLTVSKSTLHTYMPATFGWYSEWGGYYLQGAACKLHGYDAVAA